MSQLVFGLICLAIPAWVCTYLLVTRTTRRPTIGALSERAGIAILVTAFGTYGVLSQLNREAGYPMFDVDTSRVVFVVFVVAMLATPIVWLFLYATNRLGGGQ